MGSEIKPIGNNSVSLVDAYCYFKNGELFVKGMNIPEGKSDYTHEPLRDRKLLLKKRELRKLEKQLINGLTIVPYRMFRNNKGLIKLEIVLAKGKKLFDKRNTIKGRDIERDVNRQLAD